MSKGVIPHIAQVKKVSVQKVALRYLMEFVNEDHDAQLEIMLRAGLPDTQEGIDLLNEALGELQIAVEKKLK